MSARLDQPYSAIVRVSSAVCETDVPPPIDYLGSNCPEYDRHVNALFFAPFSPGSIHPREVGYDSRQKKIRPEWSDTAWSAALRLKAGNR